ncbi:Uncharacterized protein ALO70_00898 [Pseudomonas amygdali pv. eriobotryae]|uniref:HEPN/Toprim N-terminal domain-containing protein n=1 Tax=Pseudomonas amygdali pv. eriobotryae TaxID=129137 RepID=A0A0P9RNI4_PSEA0|nr:HEPN/Toprim-associated domain-containing protein [Pseudomonas amygdali]KPX30507.1 Uncharacterized protein ALO70_00898 [Pseudomonas amygdali pv. eriobotryae]KWS71972.1 hypothetical protein AL052_17615 [Pseudomonas amygdali pv. eriobotryae]RMM02291.1 hypothetical protein ALQ86_00936 [Pseudomonas amygdali pv. eriobotryae]RMO63568.1 hypothetical protein ALQ39_00513 [Pseudomonas amygdali pv. eriobotryae]
MGTEVTLKMGGVCIDWSKNGPGNDHGQLFQSHHQKRVTCDQLDYNYPDLPSEFVASMERSMCALLKDVFPRLELLGFTLEAVRQQYDSYVSEWEGTLYRILEAEESDVIGSFLGFDEFCEFVKNHPVKDLDGSYDSKFVMTEQFVNDPRTSKVPVNISGMAYSETSLFGAFVGFLHPYAALRVCAECEKNLDSEVLWNWGPVVEEGYAEEADFQPGAGRKHAFLIATEGSSDVHIIKHALHLLKPEVEGFFRFIDVSESHPFPGTGGLVKFADGLIKIDIQNNVIFVFDNDAEGYEAYLKIARMPLLANMRVMLLPELKAFESFLTKGPGGESMADINRRAAAIECYLDLTISGCPQAKVVWTTYKKDLNAYHGALEHKESYARDFFKQTNKSILNGAYDTSKLSALLDALIQECFAIGKISAQEYG